VSAALAFFLLCSAAKRSRNSFCFASNDFTPSGVISERAGERHNKDVDANVRMKLLWVVSELELLRIRRANIVCGVVGVDGGSRGCCV
jgi:hypothetical protein